MGRSEPAPSTAEGFRCVRFDVSGVGDSPARVGHPGYAVHSLLAIDDVLDAVRAVSPDDPGDVVLFGLSSSGYHILEAALSLSPRGICSVNPSLVFNPPEMASGGVMDGRRRFCLTRDEFVTSAPERRPIEWPDRLIPIPSSNLPEPVRKVDWPVRTGATLLGNRPGERVRDLVHAGTDVLLICGCEEFEPFSYTGINAVCRGEREAGLRIEVIPTLEHSLLPSSDRDRVAELNCAHVLTRFRLPPATT